MEDARGRGAYVVRHSTLKSVQPSASQVCFVCRSFNMELLNCHNDRVANAASITGLGKVQYVIDGQLPLIGVNILWAVQCGRSGDPVQKPYKTRDRLRLVGFPWAQRLPLPPISSPQASGLSRPHGGKCYACAGCVALSIRRARSRGSVDSHYSLPVLSSGGWAIRYALPFAGHGLLTDAFDRRPVHRSHSCRCARILVSDPSFSPAERRLTQIQLPDGGLPVSEAASASR